MNIGERINHVRKKNNLSQDAFANLFHVTRQTVSNWENGKSYPDLEMLLKISDEFHISVDELLKGDVEVVKKIDSEKKNTLYIVIAIMLLIATVSAIWIYKNYEASNAVSFLMKQSKTYQKQESSQSMISVGNGFFVLPKDDKINIKLEAATDDGTIHIKITDSDANMYYQLDGQSLNDTQTLHFPKGSYNIQITADDYTEEVVSIHYYIKVSN